MSVEGESFTKSIHLALYSYLSLLGCNNSLVMLQNEMDVIYNTLKPEQQREITSIFVHDILHCKSLAYHKRKILFKDDEKKGGVKKMKSNTDDKLVQLSGTNDEIQSRIEALKLRKKSEINESNKIEFIDQEKYKTDMCARSSTTKINRNQQLKLNIIKNLVGPLDRSIAESRNNGVKSHEKPSSSKTSGVDERINNIKEHLNITTPLPVDIYKRIKILEDKIMKLEEDYPTWASIHFNQPNKDALLKKS